MKITKSSEYALLICFVLARTAAENPGSGEKSVGSGELAYQLSISMEYIQQVVQKLRRAKLITSVKGPGGGFLLARPAAEISLLEIMAACESEVFQVICDSAMIDCGKVVSKACCPIRLVWFELREQIESFLASRNLAWLVERWHSAAAAPAEEAAQFVASIGALRTRP